MCAGRFKVEDMPYPGRSSRAVALVVIAAVSAATLAGCAAEPDTKKYPFRGQILAIGEPGPGGRRDVTVKHEDIPGFMPAMTMPYLVRPPSQLDGLAKGDLVSSTLVLEGSEIYLTDLKKTGHAELPPDAKPVKIMDVMQPGDEVPDDALQDQTGATRKLSDWRGRALAVTFVYTRCPLPDFCPLMDKRFGELEKAIAADARLRDRVHLVSVSFDPAHDTQAVIATHAKARGADPRSWSYLTGAPAAVDHFTSRFGVSTIRETDAAQTITHNLRTAVIDPKGRLVKIHSGNDWIVDALLTDLREASGQ
jgi:protein SCO1/2